MQRSVAFSCPLRVYTENMTERQKFFVIQDLGLFELRAYEPCVIAQISMPVDYQSATSGAFRYLFNYISKGNATATPIAMTAPVIASTKSDLKSDQWHISFVMPAGSSLKDLPIPNDSKVVLKEVAQEKCVALSFKGRASTEVCERKESELRALAKEAGLALSTETRICRFDPPFKPGFMMYNEVVIPLA